MGRSTVLGTTLAVVAALVLPVSAQAEPSSSCEWSWTYLPLPAEFGGATAQAAAGHGTYAATAWKRATPSNPWPGLDEALLWQDGEIRSLGSAFGRGTWVKDVNAAGVVVGQAGRGPVRYRDGAWEELPVPEGWEQGGVATDVNSSGDAVGILGLSRWILWPAARPGTYELISKPVGGYGEITDIGDDGTLTAWASMSGTGQATGGFIRHPGGPWLQVDRPGGENVSTFPLAVAGGVVAGTSESSGAVWDEDGRVLHTFEGGYIVDVNPSGQVLGQQNSDNGIWRAGALEAVLPPSVDGKAVTPVGIDHDGVALGQREAVFPDGSKPVVARCS